MEDQNHDSTATDTSCGSGETTAVVNWDDLPEHIILHIFSFLPTLNTIAASLVCKRWCLLWPLVPSLNLFYSAFPPSNTPSNTRHFFAQFVDRTLISRSNSPLDKFRLNFIYEDCYGFHVDSWIRYAVKNRAQDLILDFFIDKAFHIREPHLWDTYDFPFSSLRNGEVRTLKLIRCDLTMPTDMSSMILWSMKSIYLDQICMTDQMALEMIGACPNLEFLRLGNCYGMNTLKVCSGKLKELELKYIIRSETEVNLEIDCPNLVSLSIIWFEVGTLCVKNLSSLVRFRTSVGHQRHENYGYWTKIVRMLDQVPHISSLSVQNWWFKLVPKKFYPEGFVLYNLKHLELQTGYTQYDLLGMAALLELTPNVETIILDYLFKIGKDETLSAELLNKPIYLSLTSVKEVKMKRFTGTANEARFVLLLKKQGLVLEKIVVVPRRVTDVRHPTLILRKRPQTMELVE